MSLSHTMATASRGVARLFGPPAHEHRFAARRRLARHALWAVTLGGIALLALMAVIDVPEIRLMPPRGTASLWPVRIITDFGKTRYVLTVLGAGTCLAVLAGIVLKGQAAAWMLGLSGRLAFLFLAGAVPALIGEILKGVIGRGRPFVGGAPDAFHYNPFAWTEAYASLPSGHAITAFALALAVSALAPRWAVLMWVYAGLIAISRLVLLAHHPSDVLAGAIVGIIGAMAVRYWFAARNLIFTIGPDGAVKPISEGQAVA